MNEMWHALEVSPCSCVGGTNETDDSCDGTTETEDSCDDTTETED